MTPTSLKESRTLFGAFSLVALLIGAIVIATPVGASSSCNQSIAIGSTIRPTSINPTPFVRVRSTSERDIAAAIEQISDAGGGTLHFPAGEYTIGRQDRITGNVVSVLSFWDVGDLKITGAGRGTVLRLDDDGDFRGSWIKTIQILGAERLEIANLRIVGQRDLITPPSVPEKGEQTWMNRNPNGTAQRAFDVVEQGAQILLRGVARSTYIHDIEVSHGAGDGINLAGLPNVVIADSNFDDLGRNGITVGGRRGTDRSTNVLITGNTFGGDIDTQQIDFELHGSIQFRNQISDRSSNVQVRGNHFRKQRVADDIDKDQWAMTIAETNVVDFSNNRVENPVLQIHSSNVYMHNNTDFAGLLLIRTGTALIVNNDFDLVPHTFYEGGVAIEQRASYRPDSVILRGNSIQSRGIDVPVRLSNPREAFVEDNSFGSLVGADHLLSVLVNNGLSVLNESGNGFAAKEMLISERSSGDLRLTNTDANCSNAPVAVSLAPTTTTRAPQPTTTNAPATTSPKAAPSTNPATVKTPPPHLRWKGMKWQQRLKSLR